MNIQPKYVLLLLAFWGGLLQAQTIKTEDLYIRDPYALSTRKRASTIFIAASLPTRPWLRKMSEVA